MIDVNQTPLSSREEAAKESEFSENEEAMFRKKTMMTSSKILNSLEGVNRKSNH